MTVFNVLKRRCDRASRSPQKSNPSRSLLFPEGDRAVVLQSIEPDHLGRISYQGTHWFACGINDVYIPENTLVKVLSRRGTTWLVQPID
ncbi:MAG: NfeD family protein [Cyanobacteria bacterium P01_F01_bin.150]